MDHPTRSVALWLPELCMAKVERSRGKLIQSMGATHDGCAHLYPEEVLFLAEVQASARRREQPPARNTLRIPRVRTAAARAVVRERRR